MHRPSLWMMIVVLLAGLLFLREPRLQRSEEFFLRWLMKNSQPRGASVPLTVVEIGRDPVLQINPDADATERFLHGTGSTISPLEYALFLQAILEFKPTVVAFEPILKWREREKDQEQVFVDQAMRVPKLLLGAELTRTPDPDAPVPEIPGFTNVSGKRGNLAEFSGIGRQPSEDVRFISTLGFVNLPVEIADDLHVPLLFQYRGEVIPAFALQAVLVWMKVPLSEARIEIGKQILLPGGKKIPIRSDGTALINPNAAKRARQMTLNELLLAAQQRDKGKETGLHLEEIQNQIVIARSPEDSLAPGNVFAAAIATIQTNAFVRRVSWIFDWVIILLVAAASGIVRKFSRIDLVLAAIAFTAGYCLLAIALMSRWSIWLPGVLPLGAVWLLSAICLFAPRRKDDPDLPTIAPPPPSL